VVVEAIRGERTLNQLASQFHLRPVRIGQWRKSAQERARAIGGSPDEVHRIHGAL
jgi:hypothetical protein